MSHSRVIWWGGGGAGGGVLTYQTVKILHCLVPYFTEKQEAIDSNRWFRLLACFLSCLNRHLTLELDVTFNVCVILDCWSFDWSINRLINTISGKQLFQIKYIWMQLQWRRCPSLFTAVCGCLVCPPLHFVWRWRRWITRVAVCRMDRLTAFVATVFRIRPGRTPNGCNQHAILLVPRWFVRLRRWSAGGLPHLGGCPSLNCEEGFYLLLHLFLEYIEKRHIFLTHF